MKEALFESLKGLTPAVNEFKGPIDRDIKRVIKKTADSLSGETGTPVRASELIKAVAHASGKSYFEVRKSVRNWLSQQNWDTQRMGEKKTNEDSGAAPYDDEADVYEEQKRYIEQVFYMAVKKDETLIDEYFQFTEHNSAADYVVANLDELDPEDMKELHDIIKDVMDESSDPAPGAIEEKKKVNESIGEGDIARFKEIQQSIAKLVEEAYDICRGAENSSISARAKAYWYPSMLGNVGKEFSDRWVGAGSMTNMDNSLEELEDEDYFEGGQIESGAVVSILRGKHKGDQGTVLDFDGEDYEVELDDEEVIYLGEKDVEKIASAEDTIAPPGA